MFTSKGYCLKKAAGIVMVVGAILASGHADEEVPEGMARIPAGVFEMGDAFNEGHASEQPVREVDVQTFYIDRHPITLNEWTAVYDWAVDNGYDFDYSGDGEGGDHPVQTISWYDAVKWTNARSEIEGLTPSYYISDQFTEENVYRSGRLDIANDWVRWVADGYRLPTEIEWERAARGGLSQRRFPWQSSQITHEKANYYSWDGYAYDASPTRGYHPMHETGAYPKTNPVGTFEPNDFGVYDMAGNVWEWVWDRYDEQAYELNPVVHPYGPQDGMERVRRGGSWLTNAWHARVSLRFSYEPDESRGTLGFRNVRIVF